VDVARLQADPVHRRQVADGIALVRVQHEFRPRRGAGREVQQQRIGGQRLALGHEHAHHRVAGGVIMPAFIAAFMRAAHRDAGKTTRQRGELVRLGCLRDHVPDGPARDPIGQVVAGKQHRRWHQHGAQLDPGEHDFP
jgi:hypothetical protein